MPPVNVCEKTWSRIIYYLKKCAVTIEAMAAANLSRDAFIILRDVLEDTFTTRGDLIDFLTVLENPPFAKETNQYFESSFNKVNGLYNRCDWLKIGKNERCGKRCKQFYCRTHSK